MASAQGLGSISSLLGVTPHIVARGRSVVLGCGLATGIKQPATPSTL